MPTSPPAHTAIAPAPGQGAVTVCLIRSVRSSVRLLSSSKVRPVTSPSCSKPSLTRTPSVRRHASSLRGAQGLPPDCLPARAALHPGPGPRHSLDLLLPHCSRICRDRPWCPASRWPAPRCPRTAAQPPPPPNTCHVAPTTVGAPLGCSLVNLVVIVTDSTLICRRSEPALVRFPPWSSAPWAVRLRRTSVTRVDR